jgi:flagellin-like protein
MKYNRMRKEKAVSPVIATVLLIMIVIILAIIILLWSRSFIKETILKEVQGVSKNAEQFCPEVQLRPDISEDASGTFGFTNTGNIPIYSYKIKLVSKGGSETKKVDGAAGLVNPGFGTTIGGVLPFSEYEQIKIIPILLGKTSSGTLEPFECPEVNGVSLK